MSETSVRYRRLHLSQHYQSMHEQTSDCRGVVLTNHTLHSWSPPAGTSPWRPTNQSWFSSAPPSKFGKHVKNSTGTHLVPPYLKFHS